MSWRAGVLSCTWLCWRRQVKFRGEDGIDAGGVYREGLQRMVEDAFSERFTLLIPCPNAARHSGDNLGSFLPNPKHTSPRAMEMLAFLGRLMGLSLRHKSALPFMLPSLVWKPLVGDVVGHEDLLHVDELYAEFIHTIRHCDKDFTLNNEPHAPITSEVRRRTVFACGGSERVCVCGVASFSCSFFSCVTVGAWLGIAVVSAVVVFVVWLLLWSLSLWSS